MSFFSKCWLIKAAAIGLLVIQASCERDPNYLDLISLRTSAGFSEALSLANSRIQDDPNDGEAWAVSALVYANGADYLGMTTGSGDRRDEALRKAIELDANGPFTRAAAGLANMATDTAYAERQLTACIAETPEFLECQNLYGDLLRKSGRLDAASAVYLDALSRWPDDGELLVSLALLHQENGDPEKGIAILRALVSEQPDFARGKWHLATMLYESDGDLTEARLYAEEALETDALILNGQLFLQMLDDAS